MTVPSMRSQPNRSWFCSYRGAYFASITGSVGSGSVGTVVSVVGPVDRVSGGVVSTGASVAVAFSSTISESLRKSLRALPIWIRMAATAISATQNTATRMMKRGLGPLLLRLRCPASLRRGGTGVRGVWNLPCLLAMFLSSQYGMLQGIRRKRAATESPPPPSFNSLRCFLNAVFSCGRRRRQQPRRRRRTSERCPESWRSHRCRSWERCPCRSWTSTGLCR